MPRKKRRPEQIVVMPRQLDVVLSQGRPVSEAIRTIAVTSFAARGAPEPLGLGEVERR